MVISFDISFLLIVPSALQAPLLTSEFLSRSTLSRPAMTSFVIVFSPIFPRAWQAPLLICGSLSVNLDRMPERSSGWASI